MLKIMVFHRIKLEWASNRQSEALELLNHMSTA